MEDVYRELQKKIDAIGMGMPPTETGCELDVLKDFYTEEEAAFALDMPLGSHTVEELAGIMHRSAAEVQRMMDSMTHHGAVFSYEEDGKMRYYLLPPIHGYIEFNLYRFGIDETKHFAKYFKQAFGGRIWGTPEPTFRILPVNRAAVAEDACLPMDDAEQIIERHERYAIVDCQCRKAMATSPNFTGCKNNPDSIRVCMMFDSFADFYVKQGMGEYTTKEECLELLRTDDALGNVVEVLNTQSPEVMCACCSCCCTILMGYRFFGGEAGRLASNYRLVNEAEKCVGCGRCVERCSLSAIHMEDGKAVVDSGKCLGCGLCVSSCTGGAMRLHVRPEEEIYTPPGKNMAGLYDHLTEIRMPETGGESSEE